MILIGLTGSIGSGKSTVSSILTKQPLVGVVDADSIARNVVSPDSPAYYGLLEAFGKGILHSKKQGGSSSSGKPQIDREKLAKLVFEENPESIATLNNLTHPWILLDCIIGVLRNFVLNKGCCFVDAPLLIEGNLHKYVSKVVVVKAEEKVILERLAKKNPKDDALSKRLKFQMPQDEKVALADYLIDNSGSLEALEEQVMQLLALTTRSRLSNFVIWLFGFFPAISLLALLYCAKRSLYFYCSITKKKGD